MDIVVSTIVRSADREEDGYVYVIDWESGRVKRKFRPPIAMNAELGPRGGTRGYRGITFTGEHCLIANNDSIFAYNSDWQVEEIISNKLFCDIHEIRADEDSIWVVSTGVDAVLKCDRAGSVISEWFLGELPTEFREQLGIEERRIDRSLDHRVQFWPSSSHHVSHPNAVTVHGGRPYVTLYNQGAVIGLEPLEIVWQNRAYLGSHSGRLLDDQVLCIARSYQRAVDVIDLSSGALVSRSAVLPDAALKGSGVKNRWQGLVSHPAVANSPVSKFLLRSHLIRTILRELPGVSPRADSLVGWARGLAVLDDTHILVGSSPAAVSLINVATAQLERYLQLDDAVANSVFEVSVDPRTGGSTTT